MQRGKIVEEMGVPSEEAGERGLKFLCVRLTTILS